MATNPRQRRVPKPTRAVIESLLDSDPSIRWQVMRDLVGAPAEQVATEGWGAQLLALRVLDWYSAGI